MTNGAKSPSADAAVMSGLMLAPDAPVGPWHVHAIRLSDADADGTEAAAIILRQEAWLATGTHEDAPGTIVVEMTTETRPLDLARTLERMVDASSASLGLALIKGPDGTRYALGFGSTGRSPAIMAVPDGARPLQGQANDR